ncbi:tRNA-uridine aminocarboxypropyltransferase [Vibrio taketomensis]|uniref:tRNA-uridine aminocarboxypropyltransferase n=1 Tax=Vibrio taketomensis TaxID=2572923 RepID=UPI00138A3DCA|nr:DTW domain-containing protein [Vibrio taketomensis]
MSAPHACAGCGLHHQCVCHLLPHFDIPAHIALLMHENELTRDTNTGQWLIKAIASTSQHVWQRKAPCPKLMALINSQQYQPYLLFPSEESVTIEQAKTATQAEQKRPLLIILDGTWQEAGKMLRKSAWLAELPHVHIQPNEQSDYQLRRNQQQGHLCTLEVGTEIVKELGLIEPARQLSDFFHYYMRAFKADKSGHALKD